MSIDENDVLVYNDQAKTVFCDKCDVGFAKISELVEHMRNIHDVKEFDKKTRNNEESENFVYVTTENYEIEVESNTRVICESTVPLESQEKDDAVEIREYVQPSRGNSENRKNKTDISKNRSNVVVLKVESVPEKVLTTGSSNISYMCEFCGKTYYSLLDLRNHQKNVHAALKLHMCDLCERNFASMSALENHRRSHTKETPYKCPHCDKKFRTPNSMYVHQRKRDNCKPWACTKCEKRYLTKESLLEHETTHEDNVSYVCETCGKSFGVKRNLLRHFRVHSTDETFICPFCPSKFRQKRYLRVHTQIHHPDK